MFVPNFKNLGQVVAEKSLTKNIFGKKEKWTNKGTVKPYVADPLIHSITCHTECAYQNFKILGTVVPEKSLTEKSLHTN